MSAMYIDDIGLTVQQILNMNKFHDSTNLDKFHDNWEIVIEGYIRQHLAKYNLHQNIPPEIIEWLWLFADRLSKEEKRTIVVGIAPNYQQLTNKLPDEFETHSYNYKVKKWSDIYLDSYDHLKSKTDAIILIVDVNSDKDTIQQTYTEWFSFFHHLGIKQMVICIATTANKDMNETKYNDIKDAMINILAKTGYHNFENQIPFIPIGIYDKENNTFTKSNEKQFVWYQGYDALLIPTLNTEHEIHTLYDVLERIFIPSFYDYVRKPFIFDIDSCTKLEEHMHICFVGDVICGSISINQRVKMSHLNTYGNVLRLRQNGKYVDCVQCRDDNVEITVVTDMQIDDGDLRRGTRHSFIGGFGTFNYDTNMLFRIKVYVIGDGQYQCNMKMEIVNINTNLRETALLKNIAISKTTEDEKTSFRSTYIKKGDEAVIDLCFESTISSLCLLPFEQNELFGFVVIYEKTVGSDHNVIFKLAMIGRVEEILS